MRAATCCISFEARPLCFLLGRSVLPVTDSWNGLIVIYQTRKITRSLSCASAYKKKKAVAVRERRHNWCLWSGTGKLSGKGLGASDKELTEHVGQEFRTHQTFTDKMAVGGRPLVATGRPGQLPRVLLRCALAARALLSMRRRTSPGAFRFYCLPCPFLWQRCLLPRASLFFSVSFHPFFFGCARRQVQ